MASGSDAMSEAAYKVFNTVELLETILLGIDPKTLLLSQRVAHTFKATIATSSRLQKVLFFKRDPDVLVNREDLINNDDVALPVIRNKLLTVNNFHDGTYINTPEGYTLKIVDIFRDPCFYICIDGQLPTTELPATGSWRKMHAWKGQVYRTEVDVMADGVELFVALPDRLQMAAMGDVLDYVLERYRSGDVGDDLRIWE